MRTRKTSGANLGEHALKENACTRTGTSSRISRTDAKQMRERGWEHGHERFRHLGCGHGDDSDEINQGNIGSIARG